MKMEGEFLPRNIRPIDLQIAKEERYSDAVPLERNSQRLANRTMRSVTTDDPPRSDFFLTAIATAKCRGDLPSCCSRFTSSTPLSVFTPSDSIRSFRIPSVSFWGSIST